MFLEHLRVFWDVVSAGFSCLTILAASTPGRTVAHFSVQLEWQVPASSFSLFIIAFLKVHGVALSLGQVPRCFFFFALTGHAASVASLLGTKQTWCTWFFSSSSPNNVHCFVPIQMRSLTFQGIHTHKMAVVVVSSVPLCFCTAFSRESAHKVESIIQRTFRRFFWHKSKLKYHAP